MDADLKEVADHIGSELEFLLPSIGLKLPEGLSGAEFMIGVFEGAAGIERDPALFSWLGVKIAQFHLPMQPDDIMLLENKKPL